MDNTGNSTYLNTAACGLLPEEFTIEANQLYKDFAENASKRAEYMRDTEMDYIRGNVSQFIGCAKENLAFIPNFSWGMNSIVQSLKGTEKVLLYENDYPSLTEPFKINAFDVFWLKDVEGFSIPLEEIKKRIVSDKIDLLAISHVQWLSGFKIDLVELSVICKEHGVTLIVDATQSLGAIDIDLSELDIDVFISSVYKWMNAGFGIGVMYVADDFIEKNTPAIGGFNSYAMHDGVLKYVPSIKSYEPGGVNMYGTMVLNAAVNHRKEKGIDNIESANKQLTQNYVDQLKGMNIPIVGEYDSVNRASIVCLKDVDGLWSKLQANNIIAAQRGGNIRTSVHYYNTDADINKLIEILKGN